MRFVHLVAALSASTTLLAQNPAPAAPSRTPALDAVARAMGGVDRIRFVRSIVLEGRGESVNFGQNYTPTAATKFEITSYRAVIDIPNRRWFVDQTVEPRFLTANTAPVRQRVGFEYDANVAFNIAASGNMTRANAQVAAARAYEFVFHPIPLMMAALAPPSVATVTEEPPRDNLRPIRISMADPRVGQMTMFVDTRTNLPTRVERVIYQPMLGDVTLAMDFADYQDVGGLKVPMRLTRRYENLVTLTDLRLSRTAIDEDPGNTGATDSIRAVVLQSAPPAPTVTVEELAPGVWWIGGGTHHTIAIEQSRSVVLVESPQNDDRTLAAIAKARELRPNKPVEMVINTHHHFDHAGGVRAAISQGLTIVTHEANRDFYQRTVFPRRHSIQQDALAKNPKPLKLVPVRDKHVLRDSVRTIEIHEVTGNPHAGTMLVVYLPAEKILIQADMYSPPPANAPAPPAFPFAANLVENIQRRGLQVERVVGIHGRPVPFSELQAAASRTP